MEYIFINISEMYQMHKRCLILYQLHGSAMKIKFLILVVYNVTFGAKFKKAL